MPRPCTGFVPGAGKWLPPALPGAHRWGVAMAVQLRFMLACAATCALTAPALAASTAYRVTDLDLRDPRMFVNFLGCRDITDSPVFGISINGELQTSIQTDGDGDGLLDRSWLIVFDPLDQAGPGSPIRFGESSCTAPMASTSCGPNPYESLQSLASTNSALTGCLGVLPGTARPYNPAVTSTSQPCFASAEAPVVTLYLLGGDMPLTLRSFRVAATFVGTPASSLVNGLMRGFLSEADADATILPGSFPLLGGQPLSAILPGGDPPGADNTNCAAHSDVDIGPGGERGWWMYFNFVAQPVSYTGPTTGVGNDLGSRLALTSPNPARASVSLSYRLDADGPASITVHDLGGRRVAEPVSGWQSAGAHSLVWDGRLDGGGIAAPGLYVIRMASANGTIARKVVLLR